jgi:2-polyprenyl-3-methyl-5-hydroxy-6-metoxy-1,4-benzoquinol methylase
MPGWSQASTRRATKGEWRFRCPFPRWTRPTQRTDQGAPTRTFAAPPRTSVPSVAGQAYLDAVWDAVPEGAEPEGFAARLAFLLEHVSPGDRVLDVGCGEGAFSAEIARAGALPTAIDVADEPLRRLRARFGDLTDVRRATAGEALPAAEDEADVVWSGEVIEHVVDVGAFARDLRRVLRPGGRLVLTTPDHPRRLLARFAIRPRVFDEHVWPYADHLRFFTRRTLAMVLTDAGFADVRVTPSRGSLRAVAR